jgi:hypothetical protein
MTNDRNAPAAFDVFTLVVLRRGEKSDEFSEADLEQLQAKHLAYRAELHRQGVLVVNDRLATARDLRQDIGGLQRDVSDNVGVVF